MDYEVGDIVKLKKQHPCGSKEWRILRVGADFRLECMNEFSEGTFTCPSENSFICTCIFLEASTL